MTGDRFAMTGDRFAVPGDRFDVTGDRLCSTAVGKLCVNTLLSWRLKLFLSLLRQSQVAPVHRHDTALASVLPEMTYEI